MPFDKIPGWYAFKDVYEYYLDHVARDGDQAVEIGLMFGKSIAALDEGAAERGLKVQVFGVDPFEDNGHWLPPVHDFRTLAESLGGPYPAFCAMMFQNAPKSLDRIKIHRMSSLEARPLFKDKSCALVLIDGPHSYEGCFADIQAWRTAVTDDGILAGDDYHPGSFPGVCRAVEEAFGAGNFTVRGTSWIYGRHAEALGAVPSADGPTIRVLPGFALGRDWMIAKDLGGARWLGKAIEESDEVVVLSPAFEMPPPKLFFPQPKPGNSEMGLGELALSGMWSSMGTPERRVEVRWTTRERLADLPKKAQDAWAESIAMALGVQP